MQKKLNLQEQLAQFEKTGEMPFSNGETGCYCFFDWFCKDQALEGRANKLISKLKKFMAHRPELDPTKIYAFFKNNCPMVGPLYDDFRICDLESRDIIYTVVPKCSHSGKAEVWGRANNFEGPIQTADTWSGLFKA